LKKGDLKELKAYANPPEDIKILMKAIMIVLGRKPQKSSSDAGWW